MVVFAAAAILGCGPEKPRSVEPQQTILLVDAIQIKKQTGFSFPVTYYGRIQPTRRTPLAFEISGKITNLAADEGQVVNLDQPIAWLDTSLLMAERKRLLASQSVEQTVLRRLKNGEREEVIAGSRAMVRSLNADLEQAVLNRNRLKKLRGSNTVTESEYEVAFFRVESIQASLDAAKARLEELETGAREEDIDTQENRLLEMNAQVSALDTRISKAVLKAPFSANVVQRLADEGAVVQQGQAIFVVSEAEEYEARFSVPISQLGEAKFTRAVSVQGLEIPVQRIRTIASVSPDTRTIDIVFTLDDKSKLYEGQACSLRLMEQVKVACIELPASALVPGVRGLWSVYRLDKSTETNDFHVVREDVTVNHSSGDLVVIDSSLPDYSLIVSQGVQKLAPGMLVRIEDSQE